MIKSWPAFYRTVDLLNEWQNNLKAFNALPADQHEHPALVPAQRDGIKYTIEKLERELNEFIDLFEGRGPLPDLNETDRFGESLIKWRIARRWTFNELAEKLGVEMLELYAYEGRDYETAPFGLLLRMKDIFEHETPDDPQQRENPEPNGDHSGDM